MYWINFLHIYQPANQSREIIKRVANECYRPLFKGFLKVKNCKINLNINGALTELLVKNGFQDVIDSIKELAETKRLEFTESAKYHTLLPFLTEEEIVRQIKSNNQTNKKYFGAAYQPKCFFPPEMAYSPKLGEIISSLYPMILLDEVAFPKKPNSFNDKVFKLKGKKLIVIFRERRTSNAIMSALVRNEKDFSELLEDDINKNIYLCTGMDGETFGHHRPGLEKSLIQILSAKKPKQIFLSELTDHFKTEEELSPLASTWASSLDDIQKGIQFYSWKNPQNKVQELQWEFLDYTRLLINKTHPSKDVIEKFDKAIASDQFFWASGEPWWSIEMIEKDAWELLGVVTSLPITEKELEKGKDFYMNILLTAYSWQRSGKIEEKSRKYKEAVKVPFKERTLEIGGKKIYQTIISLMKEKMMEGAKSKNYEKAILWRDAIWKIETKNDIYDMMHAVDLLRLDIPEKFKELDPELNNFWAKYKERYKKIQSGQPEIRKI